MNATTQLGEVTSLKTGIRLRRLSVNVLEIRPKDGPSRVFLERVQALRRNPPGKDWNGVWQLVEK